MTLPIRLVAKEAPVKELCWALQEHPEFWDQNTGRTAPKDSPHYGLSDIWVRYAAPQNVRDGEHESVWYPCADTLPVKELVSSLEQVLGIVKLGGVLITRIPSGKMCLPHTDTGWHAREYEKWGVQITSAPGQEFCFETAKLVTKPGDVFWFDNSHLHWVVNNSPYERITMIVCGKTAGS